MITSHGEGEGRILTSHPPTRFDAPDFSSASASNVKILLDARSLPFLEYGAQRRSREVKRREARPRAVQLNRDLAFSRPRPAVTVSVGDETV